MLESGRVFEAAEISRLVIAVHEARAASSVGSPEEAPRHRALMEPLLEGVRRVQDGAVAEARRALEPLCHDERQPLGVRWLSSLWLVDAIQEEGDQAGAMSQARRALALAENLDARARGLTRSKLAKLYHHADERVRALGHLSGAIMEFSAAEDLEGLAAAHLSKARVYAEGGDQEKARDELVRAQLAFPAWEAPQLFLAWQALGEGDIEQAQILARALKQRENERERMQILEIAKYVNSRVVTRDAVRELVRLRDLPPNPAQTEELGALVERAPALPYARDLYAWRLLRAGRTEEASRQLNTLLKQPLPSDLRASVTLGLGVVASRNSANPQPGARVYAATAAGYQALHRASAEGNAQPDAGAAAAAGGDDDEIEIDIDLDFDQDEAPGPARPTASANAVLDGDLQLFRVADLIEFLYRSRRTGTLVITSEQGIGALHLRQGNITNATSPGCANIGDLLLGEGVIDAETLSAAAVAQTEATTPTLLGTIFAERFGVEADQIRAAIRQQVQGALRELLGWSEGRFAFEPDPSTDPQPGSEIDVVIDTLGVLLDAARLRDEESR